MSSVRPLTDSKTRAYGLEIRPSTASMSPFSSSTAWLGLGIHFESVWDSSLSHRFLTHTNFRNGAQYSLSTLCRVCISPENEPGIVSDGSTEQFKCGVLLYVLEPLVNSSYCRKCSEFHTYHEHLRHNESSIAACYHNLVRSNRWSISCCISFAYSTTSPSTIAVYCRTCSAGRSDCEASPENVGTIYAYVRSRMR
jgi:hypothetical protein